MMAGHRALAAATLFGLAAVVLTLRVIGRPAVLDSPDHPSTVIVPTAPNVSALSPSDGSATPISKPPLMLLPDRFGATCGSGISLPSEPGWPTRAGRGTPQTSCAFAASVLQAYQKVHPSLGDAKRTLTAKSVMPCPPNGEQCDGPPVVLNCAVDAANKWVTCSDDGGKQVLLF
jgi:hypothetical protein